MIKSFIKSLMVRNALVKNFLILIFIICNQNIANCQSFFTYSFTPKCDSIEGFFYCNVGYIINGIFYYKDQRDDNGKGFFFQNTKSNTFNGDTVYRFVSKSDNLFIEFLDSLKLGYLKVNSINETMDSLIKRFCESNTVIIKKNNEENIRSKIVFVKLKLKMFYNHSYIKQGRISYKYCFNKKKQIFHCINDTIFTKPILSFELLK